MSYFNSDKGWIQFAFGNRSDRYVLPSLVETDFEHYLYYCLKAEGYEAVFFMNEVNDGPEISYLDEMTHRIYQQIKPKSIFWKLIGNQNETLFDGKKQTYSHTKEEIKKFVNQMIGYRQKTALVIPTRFFCRFFDEDATREELRKRIEKKSQEGNLFLLTASVVAEETRDLFTDETGILSELIPEIRQAAMPDMTADLYTRLDMLLPDRIVFLNGMRYGMLKNVVCRKCLLDESNELAADRELIRKVTLLLEWQFHSETFRLQNPGLFPELQKRKLSEVSNFLENQRNVRRVLDFIENIGIASGDEFYHFLVKTYGSLDKRVYMDTESPILREWDGMNPAKTMQFQNRESYLREMQRLRRRLRILILSGREKDEKQYIHTIIDRMRQNLLIQNETGFRYNLRALNYVTDICFGIRKNQDAAKAAKHHYDKINEYSINLHESEKQITEWQKEIDNCNAKKRALLETGKHWRDQKESETQKRELQKIAVEYRQLHNISQKLQQSMDIAQQTCSIYETTLAELTKNLRMILANDGKDPKEISVVLEQSYQLYETFAQKIVDVGKSTTREIESASPKDLQIANFDEDISEGESTDIEEMLKQLNEL